MWMWTVGVGFLKKNKQKEVDAICGVGRYIGFEIDPPSCGGPPLCGDVIVIL